MVFSLSLCAIVKCEAIEELSPQVDAAVDCTPRASTGCTTRAIYLLWNTFKPNWQSLRRTTEGISRVHRPHTSLLQNKCRYSQSVEDTFSANLLVVLSMSCVPPRDVADMNLVSLNCLNWNGGSLNFCSILLHWVLNRWQTSWSSTGHILHPHDKW